jgi:hypothetical protein
VLVDEIGDVVPRHPYLAFPLIGIGIEYLGRALDTAHDWNYVYPRTAHPPFDLAIDHLFAQRYHGQRLRHRLRNGLLHFYAPQQGLRLAREADPGVARRFAPGNHPHIDSAGNVTLVVEYLFLDFTRACEQVVGMRFPRTDKMSRRFIRSDIAIGA